jgi:hypothetical protein
MEIWNRITLLKLLWNLCGKSDSLWEKWVHAYYIKNQNIMEAIIPKNASWIMKAIMQQKEGIHQNQIWLEMMETQKFSMKKIYLAFHDQSQSVAWKTLFYGNMARPRALINLWIACNERLVTRDRLHQFDLIDNICCCFCTADETQQHLMFCCNETKEIWRKVLNWIQVDHTPLGWSQEVDWIIHHTKGKGARAEILKLAFIESVYEIWRYRNDISFGNDVQNKHNDEHIIDNIVYRGWSNRNLRTHLANLMMY